MDTTQLVAHVDSGRVTYDQLAQYKAPAATRTWRPVSHIELVDTLKNQLARVGYDIAREEYAVSTTGLKLFGIFDLKGDLVPGVGRSIGFRHGNDKAIRLKTVAGGRVFVCDNMSLAGDMVVINQKHVWGFDLGNSIARGLGAYETQSAKLSADINRASETELSDERARSIFAKSLFDGIVTQQVFHSAYDLYFNKAPLQPADFEDCAPRTVWGLHNAFTRALKLSTPNVQFRSTIELSKELGVWQ